MTGSLHSGDSRTGANARITTPPPERVSPEAHEVDVPLDLSTPAGRACAVAFLVGQHAEHLVAVAPDMQDFATTYSTQLFETLVAEHAYLPELTGPQVGMTTNDALVEGVRLSGDVFYEKLGRETLGPISVHFVRSVLLQAPTGATVAFPARDAEIFHEIALELVADPEIAAKNLKIVHPTVNRRTLGIQDEMTGEDATPDREDPLFKRYLTQEGFFNPNGVVIADVGCWGTIIHTMLDARERGILDVDLKGVHFLFSHLPFIRGFMNDVGEHALDIEHAVDSKHLEAIADSFEALPRDIKRATAFVVEGDRVIPDYGHHRVDSPFLASWRDAMYRGAREAAKTYMANPAVFPTESTALLIIQAAHLNARGGAFTGIFGHNTPTWSEGAAWRQSWKWGPIPPANDSALLDD